jgi:hypothetical protein
MLSAQFAEITIAILIVCNVSFSLHIFKTDTVDGNGK